MNIIPNADLTAKQREDILQLYINRDTLNSPWSPLARRMMNKEPATLTDQEWIDSHIWQIMPDGKIRLV